MAWQRLKRPMLLIAGFISLTLGIVGAFLPLLPTVPFLLLAAVCFSHASETWSHWLHSHPRFGPAINDWNERGVIRRSAKIKSLGLLLLSLAVNLWFLWAQPYLAIFVSLILICSMLFILSRPSE